MGQAPVVAIQNDRAVPELIRLLEARARADGLSGRELARLLGVDRSHWWRVVRGQDRFGPAVIARIVELYPELQAPAVRDLTGRFDGPTLRLLAEAARFAEQAEAGQHDARPALVGSGEPTG
jgi:transcriptional regulator with XRE-family HTH domain